MIEKNHGHIITLSSMAGVLGIENLVPYCGTKFAVRGMLIDEDDKQYFINFFIALKSEFL